MALDFESDSAEIQKEAQGNVDSLAVLSAFGQRLADIKGQIESLEEEIKTLKDEKGVLETVRIPDIMDSLKLSEFKLQDGSKITSGPFVQASLPKDENDKNFALAWIRSNGHEDLIKREVSVPFDRGMDEVADKLVQFAKELGMSPEDKAAIHHMTYTAFIKNLIEQGVSAPFERMGAFIGRKAKVTPPKTK